MKPRKSLRLKREVLAELSGGELTRVVGASHHCLTEPVGLCVSFQECEITHNLRCTVPTGNPCTR